MVTGEFNAHLGKLGGSRGAADVNLQRVLLHEMMERCNLSVVSPGALHQAWLYLSEWGGAYNGGICPRGHRGSLHMMSCSTHCLDDLNNSDNLPLIARLAYVPCPQADVQNGQVQPRINWDRARKTGKIDDYISKSAE